MEKARSHEQTTRSAESEGMNSRVGDRVNGRGRVGMICFECGISRAAIRRPRNGHALCKSCFFVAFEEEVHETIVSERLFIRGERVAIGISGGKDSTVLAHVLQQLNQRHDYGVELVLVSVDEGIAGYRDDSLETVKRNQKQFDLPLLIVSYRDIFGWTMDEVVAKTGRRGNCTYCGVFRRQALDRGAHHVGAQKLATGHNADDIAETVLMNLLRGDLPRLSRCVDAITGPTSAMPRVKPFKRTYEKEIVLYAYHKKLDYFATECIYSPEAYRGHARQFIKDLEAVRPSSILDIVASAEMLSFSSEQAQAVMPTATLCSQCNYISSQPICKACTLLANLGQQQVKTTESTG
mmetsp:Transcript_6895/g.14211  ORF Transcript_6895/g.14211 Transcript_6895/m.14211 type:complete len:351 (-) Transcript_6895:769-1821(-)